MSEIGSGLLDVVANVAVKAVSVRFNGVWGRDAVLA
jgi:hypothetical protein